MKNELEQMPQPPSEDHRRVYRKRCARRLCVLVLLLTYSFPLSRLVAQDEAPLINQPSENFYHAQGRAVKVVWSLDRDSVPEDGELTATLTITGATNPQRVVRPDLKKLSEFESRFVIADKADPMPGERATEVKFSYLLRPRNRSVDKVPTLQFYFYNPAAPVGKMQFPLTTARAVPITVTEAPKIEPPAIPLGEPDHLFAVTSGQQLLEKRSLNPGYWLWLVVGLTGPLCAIGWFVAWRRVFPDAVRLAKMRRSRAARRAIDTVHRAAKAIDPPAAIATAVLGYLRTRFPFPPGAVTPVEIEATLGELGVDAPECQAIAGFFRACDAARFAPPGDNGATLAADAEALVNQLERV